MMHTALNKIICSLLIILHPDILNAQNTTAPKKTTSFVKPEEVKAEFLHAWEGYKKYAWGHDAPKPLTKTGFDWYGESFLMTPIDAYDALLMMDLNEEAAEVEDLIFSSLSFDKDITVQNFEFGIRILGGLLSAYEMKGDQRFLDLAIDLADRLIPVFHSRTSMPYRYINLKTGKVSGEISNPAEIGTYLLEFGTLSRLTGDQKYYQTAKKAVVELYNRRSAIGLVGTSINVETGEWTNTDSHISGMIDSYYEYLLKSYILFQDEDIKEIWENSIAAINIYLADTTQDGLWYGHADMNTGVIHTQ